jgi:hypothetical protein
VGELPLMTPRQPLATWIAAGDLPA